LLPELSGQHGRHCAIGCGGNIDARMMVENHMENTVWAWDHFDIHRLENIVHLQRYFA